MVWSTGMANKGVVGLRLLPVDNLVLYDRNGWFVWQSFDHATDTLFVGQSLRLSGPTKLVSRKSEWENSEGKYSLVLEAQALSLYMQDASPRPLPYGWFAFPSSETALTFTATPEGNSAWLQVDRNLVAYTNNEQVDSQPKEQTFVFFFDGVRGVLAG
ncbi:hypothetical protein Taro_019592 [Colocasia esculenta]|uniref:Bulb-type lectin domain-containing protein n=1 Tax=Colocasia esculenta TaxID=4460 RepID=A0A843UUA7_COLES|nr:hypothetical protein [Colocasia esculenta]